MRDGRTNSERFNNQLNYELTKGRGGKQRDEERDQTESAVSLRTMEYSGAPRNRYQKSAIVRTTSHGWVRRDNGQQEQHDSEQSQAVSRQERDNASWGMCLLHTFMAMLGQGWAATPDSSSARIVTITAWMLGTIIYTSYTANLISHLTTDSPERPITSLREFHEQSDWKLAVEPGTVIPILWAASRDPDVRELGRRYEEKDRMIYINFSGPAEHVSSFLQPKVLTFINIRRLRSVVGEEVCVLLSPFESSVAPRPGYITLAKGRPALRKALNEELIRLRNTGVFFRLKRKWLGTDDTSCEVRAAFHQLSLGNVMGVLSIIPLAMLLGTAIMCLEYVYRFAKRHQFGTHLLEKFRRRVMREDEGAP